MFEIPVLDANDSLTEVILDGQTYFLQLSWNSEMAGWTLAIENANQEDIIAGIGVVPDTPLLLIYRELAVPPGELIASTPDGRNSISRYALPAGDVRLVYIEADELAEAGA